MWSSFANRKQGHRLVRLELRDALEVEENDESYLL
jgi:hypothetical protein